MPSPASLFWMPITITFVFLRSLKSVASPQNPQLLSVNDSIPPMLLQGGAPRLQFGLCSPIQL
jgi:hypothetical protein